MESQAITSSSTELTDLHHYALLAICKQINNTQDQVAFAEASRDACDIFVNHVWKYESDKLVVGPRILSYSRAFWKTHFFFVKHLRAHITTFATAKEFLYPKGFKIYLRQLDRMNIKEFPNVKTCTIKHLGKISNDMMLTLTKLMPNLKTLSFTKHHLTGRNMEKFVNLEELYLENVDIQPLVINHILRNLSHLHTLDIHTKRSFELRSIPVPTLQVLRLDAEIAEKIMPHIMALPNLKELQITYPNCPFWGATTDHDGWPKLTRVKAAHNIWPHVIARKAAQITSIVINSSAVKLPENWTDRLPAFQLPKLTELKCYGWRYNSLFLRRNLKQSNLKVLSLGDWNTDQPETLARTVAQFKQLQELEIIDNSRQFYHEFQRMANVLKYSDRTQPLLIWNCTFVYHRLRYKGSPYWIDQHRVTPAMIQERFCEPELFGFKVKFDNSPNA